MVEHVSEDVLWSCTTCRACMEACPVFIEHIDSIVDMRRYLVMEQASLPDTAMNALLRCSMEARGQRPGEAPRPRAPTGSRGWTLRLWPRTATWMCCSGWDARPPPGGTQPEDGQGYGRDAEAGRRQSIRHSGHGGAVHDGDPARRRTVGNEYLYLTMAEQNIQTLNSYDVKKIVTICPHCFNSIKNEYPQHRRQPTRWSALHPVRQRAYPQQGRIKPLKTIDTTLAYHDSCYLGRHNGIYDEPREIANAIPGVQVMEYGLAMPGARLLLRRRRRSDVDGRDRHARQRHQDLTTSWRPAQRRWGCRAPSASSSLRRESRPRDSRTPRR